MADSKDTAEQITNEAQEVLEKQIAALKREINKINRSLADRADDIAEQTNGFLDLASDRAARAAQELRSRAHSVSETVKGNPGTVSTAMIIGGAVGLLVGLLVGQADNRRR